MQMTWKIVCVTTTRSLMDWITKFERSVEQKQSLFPKGQPKIDFGKNGFDILFQSVWRAWWKLKVKTFKIWMHNLWATRNKNENSNLQDENALLLQTLILEEYLKRFRVIIKPR